MFSLGWMGSLNLCVSLGLRLVPCCSEFGGSRSSGETVGEGEGSVEGGRGEKG